MSAATSPSGAIGPPSLRHPAPEGAKWIPTIVVFLVTVFVVVGGYLIAGEPQEIAVGQESPPGEPVLVTDTVTVTPPEGWSVTQRYTDPPGVRLTGGMGNLLVVVPPIDVTPEDLLEAYVEEVLEPEATQLTVSSKRKPVSLSYGEGVRTSYVGQFEGVAATIEGELTAVVSPSGTPVMFDGWSSQGQYASVRDDVRQAVAGSEVSE